MTNQTRSRKFHENNAQDRKKFQNYHTTHFISNRFYLQVLVLQPYVQSRSFETQYYNSCDSVNISTGETKTFSHIFSLKKLKKNDDNFYFLWVYQSQFVALKYQVNQIEVFFMILSTTKLYMKVLVHQTTHQRWFSMFFSVSTVHDIL